MTYKAREVLDDCRLALSLLEDETDVQRWNIHWAAAVALIRAVGHVLDKVDGEDPLVKLAADAAFRHWKSADPKHEIFREFIERERNNLLKEYRSDVHPLGEIALAASFAARPSERGDVLELAQIAKIGQNIYRPLLEGPWVANDARDVLAEAIAWWDEQLAAIDEEAARRRVART